jgi:hypothetical protein
LKKKLTSPFYFPQAFEVQNLTPNQLKFADFIMKETANSNGFTFKHLISSKACSTLKGQ